MSNSQEILLTHTLAQLNSSLSVLSQLNLLSEHDAREIRGKLPLATALNQSNGQGNGNGWGPGSSGATWEGTNNNNASSSNVNNPYPAPIYGAGAGGGGGGPQGAARAPPPLPGRSYPGLGEARAVWDYHGGAPDDLIFRKDDIIVIDEEMNNEWFKGHLSTDRGPNPRVGLFPSNYVTKIPPSNSNNNSYQSPNEPRINHSSAQYFNNNPPLNGPSHSPSPYYDDKSQSQYNNQPPYQQQQQQNQMQPYQPPPQQVQVAPPPAPEKKPGNGFGKLLATSAVGGVGFGAGSAVGSGIIHAIF